MTASVVGRFAASLGAIEDSPNRRELERILTKIAKEIEFNRVVNKCIANLGRWQIGTELRDILAATPRARDSIRLRRDRHRKLGLVLSTMDQAGVDYLVIKGVGLEPLYPETAVRDGRDYDILVRSETDFWTAVSAFPAGGFSPASYTGFMKPGTEMVVGEAVLVSEYRDDAFPDVAVDLMCSAFPISNCTCLDIDLLASAREAELFGYRFPVPGVNDTVLLLAAHGQSHGYLQMKTSMTCMSVCLPAASIWRRAASRQEVSASTSCWSACWRRCTMCMGSVPRFTSGPNRSVDSARQSVSRLRILLGTILQARCTMARGTPREALSAAASHLLVEALHRYPSIWRLFPEPHLRGKRVLVRN